MGLNSSNQGNLAASLTEQFILLAEDLSGLVAAEGMNLRPYQNREDLHFAHLSFAEQNAQLTHLRKYVEACHDTKNQGHSLDESGLLLWNMLRKLHLTPNMDLFTRINNNQIFEIYNQHNVQIFRNLNFFRICSYSLDELLSVPWWKLYRRDEPVSREIFAIGSRILNGEIKDTIVPPIPAHTLEEIESESQFKMILEVKLMSPLKSSSQAIHCFVAEEAKLIHN